MSKIRTRGGTSNLVRGEERHSEIQKTGHLGTWGGNTEKGTSNQREQCAKACRNPNEAALKAHSDSVRLEENASQEHPHRKTQTPD